MSNSRMRLMTKAVEKPTNSSKGKGLILETPYKPGFVDDKDLETVKMAVDKELSDISNAFYQTTERTADTITRIDKIEIGTDGIGAKIEEVDRVSKEGDIALASRITTISAHVNQNTSSIITESEARASADEVITKRVDTILGAMQGDLGPLVGQIQEDLRVLATTDGVLASRIDTVSAEYKTADEGIKASIKTEEEARVTADKALASQITTVESKLGQDIASVKQYADTEISKVDGKVNTINAKWGVSVNVNDKITGIQLNNDGKSSAFSVQADRFTFSDGSNTTNPPFEIVGGHTRIMSAFVNSIQSDNWDGGNNGWAITRDGWARFNNVSVRGSITATDGYFENVRITGSCVYEGQINSNQIQDTAVTAMIKSSNQVYVSSGVGNSPITADLITFHVTTARAYDRIVQFDFPGVVQTNVSVNDRNKAYQIFADMYYNGGHISRVEIHNASAGGANYTSEKFSPCVVSGNIPAGTTGQVLVRYFLYLQDSHSQTIRAPSLPCQISIFKVSGELSH